jgi:ubiquinone/menaquinone biosynthesis C-methylase UbiE
MNLIQEQFHDKTEAYARSEVHAKGESLQRLGALIQPEATWRVLDVATGAGHTAHLFAPLVAQVVAADLTATMLAKAQALAQEKGVPRLDTAVASAHTLPFASASFDLITCRQAAHHFTDPAQFLQEVARLLRPGGLFALVDNIVPHTASRTKKRQREYAEAAQYINAFEKLRDPSHGRCLSVAEWAGLHGRVGLTLTRQETIRKPMDFAEWCARMNVSPDDRLRLRAMLQHAPNIVLEFLTPTTTADKIAIQLTEEIFISIKL